jgi:predicted flap endonuclease-1-like 5' DNA nuclease
MSTTLHETPTHPSAPPPPRRRRVALFAAGAVLVAGLGSGGALALANRNDHQSAATPSTAAAAQPAANIQSAQPAGQSAKPATPTPANHDPASSQQRGSDSNQTSGSGHEQSSTPSGRLHREGVVTLADGRYDAYVRKVDPDRDLIVVDLVQVFNGDAAVRAAIEDGMDRSAAEVRDTYVRNQNPRLRTLEMASNVRLHLIGSCESTGQEALFTKLINDATYGQGQLFYYTLQVQGGVVRQIDEHQAQPAC